MEDTIDYLWAEQSLVRTLVNSFNSNLEETELLALQLEILNNHLGNTSSTLFKI